MVVEEVDADLELRPFLVGGCELVAGLLHQRARHRDREARRFGKPDEGAGRDDRAVGLAPADQHLASGEAAVLDVDDRLVERHELAVANAAFDLAGGGRRLRGQVEDQADHDEADRRGRDVHDAAELLDIVEIFRQRHGQRHLERKALRLARVAHPADAVGQGHEILVGLAGDVTFADLHEHRAVRELDPYQARLRQMRRQIAGREPRGRHEGGEGERIRRRATHDPHRRIGRIDEPHRGDLNVGLAGVEHGRPHLDTARNAQRIADHLPDRTDDRRRLDAVQNQRPRQHRLALGGRAERGAVVEGLG